MPDAQKDIGFCEDPPCPHTPKFGKDISELQPGLRIATVKKGNGAPAIGLIALRKFRAARLGLPGDRALKYESTPVFRPCYMVSRILKLTRSPYIHR
ncbi:MAG: hypothetical protein QOH96_4211 [Blastocatellia bacterium]|jgi:hypothetical protein|nr:hypothetical protein [Blastocatellia bacterium]